MTTYQLTTGKETSGDSSEYRRLIEALSMEGCPVSYVSDAVKHIMKRLGPPLDEAAVDADAETFSKDHRV